MSTQFHYIKSLNPSKLLKIRLSPCPYCKKCGYIVLHGFLKGLKDGTSNEYTIRGRRFFCSNKRNNDGCGRTFSALKTNFIKNFTISSTYLEAFLKEIFTGKSIKKAGSAYFKYYSNKYPYRIWRTFKQRQYKIRSFLFRSNAPPTSKNNIPTFQTLEHLFSNFKSPSIKNFQYAFQISIL